MQDPQGEGRHPGLDAAIGILSHAVLIAVENYRGMAEPNECKTNVELKNQLLQIPVKAKLRGYVPAMEVRRFFAKTIGGAKT